MSILRGVRFLLTQCNRIEHEIWHLVVIEKGKTIMIMSSTQLQCWSLNIKSNQIWQGGKTLPIHHFGIFWQIKDSYYKLKKGKNDYHKGKIVIGTLVFFQTTSLWCPFRAKKCKAFYWDNRITKLASKSVQRICKVALDYFHHQE